MVDNNNTFLAVFVGSKTNPRMQAWMAMPEAQQQAKMKEGIAAWHAWMQKHAAILAYHGGPLGKTKSVGPNGIADISNNMGGFCVIRADSHAAAAKLFENHPHFTIFPGEGIEVMPVMPVPGG